VLAMYLPTWGSWPVRASIDQVVIYPYVKSYQDFCLMLPKIFSSKRKKSGLNGK